MKKTRVEKKLFVACILLAAVLFGLSFYMIFSHVQKEVYHNQVKDELVTVEVKVSRVDRIAYQTNKWGAKAGGSFAAYVDYTYNGVEYKDVYWMKNVTNNFGETILIHPDNPGKPYVYVSGYNGYINGVALFFSGLFVMVLGFKIKKMRKK